MQRTCNVEPKTRHFISDTIRARILYCAYDGNEKHAFICPPKGIRMGEMIKDCQTHSKVIANIEGSRFRRPKNADEEAGWLVGTSPQNTRNSTKWSVKIFKEWQSARSNKVVTNESLDY